MERYAERIDTSFNLGRQLAKGYVSFVCSMECDYPDLHGLANASSSLIAWAFAGQVRRIHRGDVWNLAGGDHRGAV
jgi:hypothetical protein